MRFHHAEPQPRFPLWEYLNQPLFQSGRPVVLNPRQFWQARNIRLLERCWTRSCQPEGHQQS